MALLDEVKVALRVSSDVLDSEVQTLVDASLADLVRAGVPYDIVAEEGPLVKVAVICYCKAHFGYDNPEAGRFAEAYRQTACDLVNSSSSFARWR